MLSFEKGNMALIINQFNHNKNPSLCIKNGSVLKTVASFKNQKSADDFVETIEYLLYGGQH